MHRILLLCLLFLSFVNCKNPSSSEADREKEATSNRELTTAEAIAYKNGYAKWKEVSELTFTFNVDRGDTHSERSWIWNPQSQQVTLITGKDTVSYNRKETDSIPTRADAAFINDRYWLLAPFNLMWDEGTTFSEAANVIAPISKDTLNKLTVVYGLQGGYTPGDAYDFFYSKDFIIREWIFRKGNDSLPSLITTWEDYAQFGGLELATMHKDSTGTFKLYFTDISVK
ncbi:hypothetical protein [Altibacter sp.]|uniref:hypothetical protein n=1 Tax=Altibacter sp. TaxID=2024823 RepID=UPI000C900BC4|nr:hypothetical protein [Altibacter sp.]MAP54265.1 hypothetical protein [Altibacter sp.]